MFMVMSKIRNAFEKDSVKGVFSISGGNIALPGAFVSDMWVAITGSIFNDGVYLLKDVPPLEMPLTPPDPPIFRLSNGTDDETSVKDETFTGVIYWLKFPPGFEELCKEVNAWLADPANKASAVVSHGVAGVYSETRATTTEGLPAGWAQVFAPRIPSNWRNHFQTAGTTEVLGGE